MTTTQEGFSFSLLIPDAEMKRILISHLINKGCITRNEEQFFVGYNKETMNTSVEFARFRTVEQPKKV